MLLFIPRASNIHIFNIFAASLDNGTSLRRKGRSMNNQFSQRVSDIIVYSKEEANRLRSRYIGPEHLLLGMLRDGEGKAIEILSKLNTNLAAIKQQIEAQLKAETDDMRSVMKTFLLRHHRLQ